ncbi:NAD-dependent epimerase [Shewanella sp. WXL01]|uniref:NAD-dependent epimerase n=1 Tax=Shewanella sp. WXL01 TaxID=2709721 RepID=UPI00143866D1|nr:NAD-dependent epimerase [Shewanella sp. WXL01]NKF50104.1 NAD-dependent epimerase [Shewanella sp. WXL01]
MKVLVTGAAGFIGSHAVKRLLAEGHSVVGVDNLNQYYDVELKLNRLKWIGEHTEFHFEQLDIADIQPVQQIFAQYNFDAVIHLAAQAGVRHSLEDPHSYMNANMMGFFSVLEACKRNRIEHLVYASSSSVYGLNSQTPYSTADNVDHPLSLYAATKKSNELMAHSYSHLYQLPTTGLRFFTVYGPWGRPDMALFKFTKAILAGDTIDIYNHGQLSRDFTYIDDIIDGLMAVLEHPPVENSAWDTKQAMYTESIAHSSSPYQVYNIGSGNPVNLMDFVAEIEKVLGKQAKKRMLPMQKGELLTTWADTEPLREMTGFSPSVSFSEGVKCFVDWYLSYYHKQ